jgi:hypothetical protein
MILKDLIDVLRNCLETAYGVASVDRAPAARA